MIREYSQVVPLGEAVKMTLSGKYPCAMCKAIAEKKNSDDSQMLAKAKHDKSILAPGCALRSHEISPASVTYFSREAFFQTRTEAPPTPPPRLA
jgi:hypothetical protein